MGGSAQRGLQKTGSRESSPRALKYVKTRLASWDESHAPRKFQQEAKDLAGSRGQAGDSSDQSPLNGSAELPPPPGEGLAPSPRCPALSPLVFGGAHTLLFTDSSLEEEEDHSYAIVTGLGPEF